MSPGEVLGLTPAPVPRGVQQHITTPARVSGLASFSSSVSVRVRRSPGGGTPPLCSETPRPVK
eukprot:1721658-Alexandrium_andersonii.AAC.1